jgi:Bacteriophage lambda head decoration protein D
MAENMVEVIGTYTPDNLFAGHNVPVLTGGIVLAKGQGTLKRGTVVGIVSATGLAVTVDSTKDDGSQIPYGILTDTIDTEGSTDIKATVYKTGLFNTNALVFGGTDTVETHQAKLRAAGIHLQANISY